MKSSWYIRQATAEDAQNLGKCMESAYGKYRERLGGVRLPPMDADYSSEIRDYPAWVVEENGEIIGGLIMSFDNDRASIANIAVDPDCQGKGIGGALMKFAESKARKDNFPELHLTTHVLLHENVSLYRHLGWKETGSDEAKIFMKKAI